MKRRVLSICLTLALCLSLLPAAVLAAPGDGHPASGDSTTQLDPAPTTPADDPIITIQDFVHFMSYGDAVPTVGNALTDAAGGAGASFAWNANQNGHFGTITMNADGTYSYRPDNDNQELFSAMPMCRM